MGPEFGNSSNGRVKEPRLVSHIGRRCLIQASMSSNTDPRFPHQLQCLVEIVNSVTHIASKSNYHFLLLRMKLYANIRR
uniref:Uncharacterized protein n=1 Tax=Rhizophora mucronata TaxID=61149 RepID=A0A2P2QMT6_RHIMU